jgi:hypothetical protein
LFAKLAKEFGGEMTFVYADADVFRIPNVFIIPSLLTYFNGDQVGSLASTETEHYEKAIRNFAD